MQKYDKGKTIAILSKNDNISILSQFIDENLKVSILGKAKF